MQISKYVEWRVGDRTRAKHFTVLAQAHGKHSMQRSSGKHWRPWRYNPKIAQRNAKLHKLKRQGITGHETKQQLREQAQHAHAQWQAMHSTSTSTSTSTDSSSN